MAKIIRGTRDSKGMVVLKGGQGGLRKLRCASCQGFAVEQTLLGGGRAYVCACGAKYTATKL
jgi:hypothetical protein